MVKQKNVAEFNDSMRRSFTGFSIGDWVEVSAEAENFESNMGYIGQVE